MISDDRKHSEQEKRWLLLGRTDKNRKLSIVFTVRKKTLIRVISARDMSKKEQYMKKSLKKIPKFKNESEEIEFWSKADISEYFDLSQLEQPSFSKLRPSSKTISIRLPESMLAKLKRLAKKKDVPYQSLIKIYLDERIEKESA